jgi:acetyl esterase
LDPYTLLDPQMAAALQRMQEITLELGPPGPQIAAIRLQAQQSRQWWNQGGPQMAQVQEATIPGTVRDVPVVIYRPTLDALLPVYIYLHGGAYRIGNPWTNDRQMRELAHDWGGVVISADYQHLPEAVFPAAVEEIARVYQMLAEFGSRWNVDGSRMAFGGSSSGANIATGAAIQLGGVQTGFLKAAAVVVAVLDQDTQTRSMQLFGNGEFFPSYTDVIATGGSYLPDPARRDDPRVDCVRAPAKIFPPMFLGAAELDAFCDSSRHMAAHLGTAGVPHELKIYRGMVHQFFGCSRTVNAARQCVRDMAKFLREYLPAEVDSD